MSSVLSMLPDCANSHSRNIDSPILQYGIEGSTESQLPTHHLSILLTPGGGEGVSTDCTPHPIVTHLHPSRIDGKCLNKSYITFLVSGAAGLSCINWKLKFINVCSGSWCPEQTILIKLLVEWISLTMPQIAERDPTLKEEEHSTSTVPQWLHHSKFSQGLHCQKWRAYKAGGCMLNLNRMG